MKWTVIRDCYYAHVPHGCPAVGLCLRIRKKTMQNSEGNREGLILEMLSSAAGWVKVESLSFTYAIDRYIANHDEAVNYAIDRYAAKHDEAVNELKQYAAFVFGADEEDDGGVRPC